MKNANSLPASRATKQLSALLVASLISVSASTTALADDNHNTYAPVRADGHAPIGVMGDHLHKKGEWMLSYRFMHMDMEGNQIGKDNVSPEEVISQPNRFGAPPNLRVVPTKMTMDMHMLGAMYAPTNNVTLMAMLPIIEKDMDHLTFNMMGANIGGFSTKTDGIGDLKFSSLIGLYNDGRTKVHLNAGFSAPTGSITERGNVLTPMNTTANLRLPYAMQLGTGTFDLLPGITIQSRSGDFSYGAQFMARFHLGTNDEGYSWGDKQELTAWIAYQWAPWISTSLRVKGTNQSKISGIDSQIAAPVQTADPNNYGGERIDLLGGVNFILPDGPLKGHRFALEAGAPVYQDLNGPQMETDFTITLGWQKAF